MVRIAFLAVGLTASLSAQVAYSNGPFQTAATGGGAGGTSAVSVLQNNAPTGTPPGLSHTVFGYGAQQAATATARNSLVDNFQVNSFLQIDSVEVFGYATGSAVPNCTGVYLAIWNVDPTTAAPPLSANVLQATSPAPADGPFAATNNRIAAATNTFTNIFRVVQVPITGTTRNVQSVVVALPSPAVLTPGQYWLEFCFNGINFVPPVTAVNVGNTGDADQFLNTTLAYAPILNGTDTQGIPFVFRGPFGNPGAITNLGGGCSPATLTVVGSTAIGGFVRAELSNTAPTALPFIAVGFGPGGPLPCACVDRVGLGTAQLFGSPFQLQIPRASASLAGANLRLQGLELDIGIVPLQCPIVGPFSVQLTDGFDYQLNLN